MARQIVIGWVNGELANAPVWVLVYASRGNELSKSSRFSDE